MSLYIDGNLIASKYAPVSVLSSVAATMNIGAIAAADTVIDDFMILKRPVNSAEALLIYQNGREAFRQAPLFRSLPDFKVDGGYSYTAQAIVFNAEIFGRRPDTLNAYRISYEVTGSSLYSGSALVTQPKQKFSIPASALPTGNYIVKVRLLDDATGASLVERDMPFERSANLGWEGNTLGIATSVPTPWTNLSRTGNALSCWGRTYDMGSSALPAQIVSQGADIFSGPIRLKAMISGVSQTLTTTSIQWTSVTPLRAEFHAAGTLGAVPVTVVGSLEYDGYFTSRITVGDPASANLQISSLALEIPLRKEVATLMEGVLTSWDGNALSNGGVGDFLGYFNSGAPSIWLGNERCGLQCWTEDTRDWLLSATKKMVQITVGSDEVVLRYNLIDHAITSPRPLTYTLGLDATPIKPPVGLRRQDELEIAAPYTTDGRARQMNFVNGSRAFVTGSDILTTTPPKEWQLWWGNWNRKLPAPVSGAWNGPMGYQYVGDLTRQDIESTPSCKRTVYWYMAGIWAGDPVLQKYGIDWDGVYQGGAGTWTTIKANKSIPLIRDYLVWMNWKNFTDNPWLAGSIKGTYQDTCGSEWTEASDVNGSYIRYNLQDTRQTQQRFYLMLKQNWPDLRVVNHQPRNLDMGQLAFADYGTSGENLGTRPELRTELSYYHILSLARMRAEFMGYNFGFPNIFLPQIGRANIGDAAANAKIYGPEGIAPAEHLLGMLWVHDVIPWIAYVHDNPFLQAARAKSAFGWDDQTKFYGYWENGSLVTLAPVQADVVASVFRRKDKALFVVMNDSDSDVTVSLSPKWEGLLIEPTSALIDIYEQQGQVDGFGYSTGNPVSIPVTNGTATFTVKARNFRALAANSIATVKPVIPILANVPMTVGRLFSYQVPANNHPTSFSAVGLPEGLGINVTTGVISGVPTTAGTYAVAVAATNAAGTGTGTLTLVVKPNVPPTVEISSHLNGAVVFTPMTIDISAIASDVDGEVSKVEFFRDAALLGICGSEPYFYAWDGAAAGIYQLSAVATDDLGATSSSLPVNLTVMTATLRNGAVRSDGAAEGSALSLNGLNSYAEAPSTPALKYSGRELTLSTWVYINPGETTGGYLLSKPFNGGGEYNYYLGLTASRQVRFLVGGGDKAELRTTKQLPAGNWHYLAATVNAGGEMRIYVDGVVEAAGSHSITNWIPSKGDLDLPLSMGTVYPYGEGWAGNKSYSFDGSMDGPAVYARALSALEISRQMGLCALWKYDDAGSLTADVSGNENNAKLVNGAVRSDVGAEGSALNLNGLNSYAEVPSAPVLKYSGGELTLSTWVYINPDETTGGYLLSKPFNGGGEYNYWLRLNQYHQVGFAAGGDKINVIWTTKRLSIGVWHHVAATVNAAKEMRVYVDGMVEAAGSHSITNWIPSKGDLDLPLSMGTVYPYGEGWAGNKSYSFDGSMDDTAIYDRALSALEISRQMGLCALWKYDDEGSLTADVSGNGNNGALVNGAIRLAEGTEGSVLSLNGLNSYAQVPSTPALKYIGGELTLSTWVYINPGETTGGFLLSKPFNGGGEYNYYLGLNSFRQVRFMVGGGSMKELWTTKQLSTGEWHSLVASVNAAREMRIYVDGVVEGAGSHSITNWMPSKNDQNLPLAIGTVYPYGEGWAGQTYYSFDGWMDDTAIYDRALSEEEVLRQ
jgi:hypothetical protein